MCTFPSLPTISSTGADMVWPSFIIMSDIIDFMFGSVIFMVRMCPSGDIIMIVSP